MKKCIWLIVIIIIKNSCATVFAQITFSPYTINGIGNISNIGLANDFGMGEVGIATSRFWHINSQNPALVINNTLTIFQMGVAAERRIIDTKQSSDVNGSAGLKYLAFAFPIINNKWSTSFGILPYSTVNYNTITTGTVKNTTVPIDFNIKGSGGLTRVYFANGFSIFNKINVGIRVSYIFGSIKNETITNIGDATFRAPFRTAIFEKIDYSGFKITGGIAYKYKLSEKNFLNFGLIYETKSNLDGNRFIRLERRTVTDRSLPGDTLTINETGVFKAPSQIGFGFSWKKLNKLIIAFDIKRNNWAKNPEFRNNLNEYKSTFSIGLGLEFIPDYSNISNYFKRIRYRLGLSYEKAPYVVQNKNINDLGINFGWSLPVKVSSLDMGFKYGQRGTTSNNLIKEKYFKFVLGVTVNDRWFIRRKHD